MMELSSEEGSESEGSRLSRPAGTAGAAWPAFEAGQQPLGAVSSRGARQRSATALHRAIMTHDSPGMEGADTRRNRVVPSWPWVSILGMSEDTVVPAVPIHIDSFRYLLLAAWMQNCVASPAG